MLLLNMAKPGFDIIFYKPVEFFFDKSCFSATGSRVILKNNQ